MRRRRPRPWSRRAFVRAAGSASLAGSVIGCTRSAATPPTVPPATEREGAGEPPACPAEAPPVITRRDDDRVRHVVFMTVDDLGWRCLGFEGNRHIATPAFDRLAATGARVPLAFGVTSTCSSSRASLVTGQYPSRHGVAGLVHRNRRFSLADDHPTMPRVLQALGYRTAVMGKFHISMREPQRYGYDANLNPEGRLHWRFGDVTEALRFVERERDHPLYLELNFVDTHLRANGSMPFVPAFPVDPERIEIPPAWALPDGPELRELTARYFSQLMQTDRMLGELLDGLEALGVAGDALVAIVSDNGAPFPGNKKTLYDRGIGTPMLVRWPGRIAAGVELPGLASTIDLAPTILDAAHAEPTPWVQGRSLLPRLRGDGELPDAVFAEMHSHASPMPMRAVRTERWKYIRNFFDGPIGLGQLTRYDWAKRLAAQSDAPWAGPRVPIELYDLHADPNELDNLAGRDDMRELEAELRTRVHCHMVACGDPLAASV